MKRFIKLLSLIVMSSLLFINGVEAKSYIKDLFRAGDNVRIRKNIDGTSFIAGNNVSVNGKINGIGFIAGNEVKINSDQEYLFVAGNEIKLNSNIDKDVFIAGESIKINDSTLNRDAYIAGNEININGSVGRNLYATGTKIILNGKFDGNISLNAESIEIKDNTVINGTLKYNENAVVTGISEKFKTKTYKEQEIVRTNPIKTLITSLISSYIHITLLAIVLVFICEIVFKKSLSETKDLNTTNLLSLGGKGLLVLLGVPILALMLAFTGVFISVGVVGGIIYGIMIYISKMFTAYSLASILDKHYFKKNMNSYLLMIVGLLIIYILSIIPVIGSLISFFSIIIGLGIISNMIIKLRTKN